MFTNKKECPCACHKHVSLRVDSGQVMWLLLLLCQSIRWQFVSSNWLETTWPKVLKFLRKLFVRHKNLCCACLRSSVFLGFTFLLLLQCLCVVNNSLILIVLTKESQLTLLTFGLVPAFIHTPLLLEHACQLSEAIFQYVNSQLSFLSLSPSLHHYLITCPLTFGPVMLSLLQTKLLSLLL